MPAFDKIVVVTQKTALEELLVRYNTRDQARFYLEHLGVSFDGYQDAHSAYFAALNLRSAGVERFRVSAMFPVSFETITAVKM